MSMNNQGRPSSAGEAFPAGIATISGDRGLDHEEALIFELGHGATGVDLPDVKVPDARLGGQRRKSAIGVYSLKGARLNNMQRGLNIVVDENGQVRKVMMK
jgi:glycine dehydrogenase subunit 2